jgi:hypothetical protein
MRIGHHDPEELPDYRASMWSRGRILAHADRHAAEAREAKRALAQLAQAVVVLLQRSHSEVACIDNHELGMRQGDLELDVSDLGYVSLRVVPRVSKALEDVREVQP